MSRYSKAVKERRFPQDVAPVAYVLLRVWSFDALTCISQAAVFVEIQEFVDLTYSPLWFVYCLQSVNIRGCRRGKRRRDNRGLKVRLVGLFKYIYCSDSTINQRLKNPVSVASRLS